MAPILAADDNVGKETVIFVHQDMSLEPNRELLGFKYHF